jgi:hypothetical protein
MLSVITVPASFIYTHFYVLIGYAICVLFPVPWLSRVILDAWKVTGQTLMTKIKSLIPSKL